MRPEDALAQTVDSDSGGDGASRLADMPRAIGRFAIVGKLGEGGMGVVWLAADPDLGRRVALKVLRGDEASPIDGGRRERFLREARATARLTHDNVIVLHEVGTHDGRVYIAMEHVAGVTLGQWQRGGRPWQATVAMYVRAGRGLAAAHAANLVHRDFKPDNVLIGDDGRVRVTDFGLVAAIDEGDRGTSAVAGAPPGARAGAEAVDSLARTDSAERRDVSSSIAPTASLTRTGAVLGTPRYMAPEQHAGQPVDPRADQFAFCVALYEALFGAPPFAGGTLAELVASVLAGNVAPIPSETPVPARLCAAISRGLAIDRAARFPTMAALLDELVASSAEPAEPVAPPAARSRSRGPWILGIAIGAIAIAGLILALSSRTDAPPLPTAPTPSEATLARERAEAARLEAERAELAAQRKHNEEEQARLAEEAATLRRRTEELDRERVALKQQRPLAISAAAAKNPHGDPGPGSSSPPRGSGDTGLKRAQAEFDAAEAANARADYEGAVAHYLAAYAARPLPEFLYNVGATYHIKGKQTGDKAAFTQAIAYYRRYLAEAPDATDRAKVEHTIGVLEKIIAP